MSSRISLRKQRTKSPSPPPPRRSTLLQCRPLRRCRHGMPHIQHLATTTTLDLDCESNCYSCEFPQELLSEILLRLASVEAIIKCIAVCKSWRCVIRSPTFIDAYLSRSLLRCRPCPRIDQNRNEDDDDDEKDDDASLILLQRLQRRSTSDDEMYALYWDKPSAFGFGGDAFVLNNADSKSILTPRAFRPVFDGGEGSRRHLYLAGTCNGLLYLDNNLEIPTIICNPLLRKFVALPMPRIAVPHQDGTDDYNYVLRNSWFGYDPRTNDYKVLRIVASRPSGSARNTSFGVELYSLARGSWKTLSPAAFPGFIHLLDKHPQTRHVFCNGALYWLLFHDNNDKECVIVSFDMVTESFREIKLPEALRSFCWLRRVSLSIHEEDSLALIVADHHFPNHNDLHLWIMQHYGVVDSWTKLSVISLGDLFQYNCSHPCPEHFGFKGNAKHVFKLGQLQGHQSLWRSPTVLLQVDFKTKQVCSGLDHESEYKSMDSFVESLVLLNHPNALSY